DAAAVVRGSVVSSALKQDARSVAVGVFAGDEQVSLGYTDQDGTFVVDDLQPGIYSLRVVSPITGYSLPVEVTVAEGQVIEDVELPIVPGVTLTGTVTNDTDGSPVSGAAVTVIAPGGLATAAYTDNNGQY